MENNNRLLRLLYNLTLTFFFRSIIVKKIKWNKSVYSSISGRKLYECTGNMKRASAATGKKDS